MKKAIYHNEDGRDRELYVLSENANGTVDLGSSEKPDSLVVGQCPVGPKGGQCSVEGAKSKAEKADR